MPPEFWPGHDGELESADDYPLAPYRLRVIDLDAPETDPWSSRQPAEWKDGEAPQPLESDA